MAVKAPCSEVEARRERDGSASSKNSRGLDIASSHDSLLEEIGLEPSVPSASRPNFQSVRRLLDARGIALERESVPITASE